MILRQYMFQENKKRENSDSRMVILSEDTRETANTCLTLIKMENEVKMRPILEKVYKISNRPFLIVKWSLFEK